jgi:hypothetical protein
MVLQGDMAAWLATGSNRETSSPLSLTAMVDPLALTSKMFHSPTGREQRRIAGANP